MLGPNIHNVQSSCMNSTISTLTILLQLFFKTNKSNCVLKVAENALPDDDWLERYKQLNRTLKSTTSDDETATALKDFFADGRPRGRCPRVGEGFLKWVKESYITQKDTLKTSMWTTVSELKDETKYFGHCYPFFGGSGGSFRQKFCLVDGLADNFIWKKAGDESYKFAKEMSKFYGKSSKAEVHVDESDEESDDESEKEDDEGSDVCKLVPKSEDEKKKLRQQRHESKMKKMQKRMKEKIEKKLRDRTKMPKPTY